MAHLACAATCVRQASACRVYKSSQRDTMGADDQHQIGRSDVRNGTIISGDEAHETSRLAKWRRSGEFWTRATAIYMSFKAKKMPCTSSFLGVHTAMQHSSCKLPAAGWRRRVGCCIAWVLPQDV